MLIINKYFRATNILLKQADTSSWRQKVKWWVFKKNNFHRLDLKTVWNEVLSHMIFYLHESVLYLATTDATIRNTGESLIASAIAALEIEGWWLTTSCKKLCFALFWDSALSRNGGSQLLALINSSNKWQKDPGVRDLYLPTIILAICCV